MSHMERVFYDLHQRVSLLALKTTNHKTRTVIEHAALVCGVCAFCIVLLCHRTFVYRGPAILATGGLGGGTAGVGGLGGAVIDGIFATARRGKCASDGILGTKGGTLPAGCLRAVPGFDNEYDVLQIAVGDEDLGRSYAYITNQQSSHVVLDETTCTADTDTRRKIVDTNFEPLYSYSRTKGFLLLPPAVQKKHNVTVQHVVVARSDTMCFGEEFLQRIVFSGVVGPSTVALNWLLALNNGTGYILPSTGQIIDLHRYASDYYFLMPRPWEGAATISEDAASDEDNNGDRTQQRRGRSFLLFKLGVLVASVFLFFVTTTLVAFTLRETQDRMLNFTFHLQEQVRHRAPIGHLIATHVVENLVFVPIMLGTIFFLIEFYGGDKFLAFMVLTIVWVSEVFSVISMRTNQGIVFFPRVFFLYFTLFHAYYFSCPFGFSYLSLLSSVLFLVHSMLFFWNRYELPAILSDRVSAQSPRQQRQEPEGTTPAAIGNFPPPISSVLAPGNNGGPGPVLLPRPLNRGQNHPSYTSMSSLGRGSVATGNLLFQDGGNHEDDDGDDSSYMYFMSGEVVMRRRSRSPSTASAGEDEPENTPEVAPPLPGTASTEVQHGPSLQAATEAASRAASERTHANSSNASDAFQAQPEHSPSAIRDCDRSPQTPRTRNSQDMNNGTAAPMRLFPFPFWDRSVRQRRVQPPGSPNQES